MGPMDQTNTDEHPQDKKKQADTLRRQRRKLNAALGPTQDTPESGPVSKLLKHPAGSQTFVLVRVNEK